jgi:hypothetical protein
MVGVETKERIDLLKRFRKNDWPSVSVQMRDLMFGDVDLAEWTKGGAEAEPWKTFALAEQVLQTDKNKARGCLETVLAMDGLETRHYLEAWTALRSLGVEAPEVIAKRVLAVVVEVVLPGGLDVLGVYADHTARYWNYSGKGVFWEHPNGKFDDAIDLIIETGQSLSEHIGPWSGPRPTDLPPDHARLSLLTPSGLHFGQGPFAALSKDPLGAPVVAAATRLMVDLTKMGKSG